MYLLLSIIYYLVGGLEHFFYFSIYWECHHPKWQTHMFQDGLKPPTSKWWTNQLLITNHGLYNPSGTMGWGQRHRCKAWPPTGWWRFSTRRAAGAVGCPEAQKLAMIHGGKSSSKPYFFGGVEPGSIPDAPWCWNMHTYIYPLKMTQM